MSNLFKVIQSKRDWAICYGSLVYSLVAFCVFQTLCNQCFYLILKQLHHTRRKKSIFIYLFKLPLPWALGQHNFCILFLALPIVKISHGGSPQYAVVVMLLSFSKIFSIIHAYYMLAFHSFLWLNNIFIDMCNSFFVHTYVGRYLDCPFSTFWLSFIVLLWTFMFKYLLEYVF